MFVNSMLHFELYAGTWNGNLTDKRNQPFQRRRDLLDPTSLLDTLAFDLPGRGQSIDSREPGVGSEMGAGVIR
jgi:hypothetical protein